MIYKSATTLFIKIAAIVGIGSTALWLVAVPLSKAWIKEWAVKPPIDIPFWKELLLYFAESGPIVLPFFIGLAWVISVLTIELWLRLKIRRP